MKWTAVVFSTTLSEALARPIAGNDEGIVIDIRDTHRHGLGGRQAAVGDLRIDVMNGVGTDIGGALVVRRRGKVRAPVALLILNLAASAPPAGVSPYRNASGRSSDRR